MYLYLLRLLANIFNGIILDASEILVVHLRIHCLC